ncbi:hypothetical protein [Photobacterium damselae]|uniref:hypothetical protein n=1 Tax=Photobacterium damselae TaxID=38293 RepID=UPI0013021769|nr:hypothetical protein [Photobacterium damselae]
MCFETGWAVLISSDLWVKWTTILMPFIAMLALYVAWSQLKSSRYESKASTAHAIYHQYLSLCLENSELAKGDQEIVSENEQINGKYKWFISSMLFSFEQILQVANDDSDWEVAIKAQLLRHAWHLSESGTVKRKEWSIELMTIINKALVEKNYNPIPL